MANQLSSEYLSASTTPIQVPSQSTGLTTQVPALNPRCYRRIVAPMPQEPALFEDSIRENIALGIENPQNDERASSIDLLYTISDAAIEAALLSANALGFVSSLPEDMEHRPWLPWLSAIGWAAAAHRHRIAIASPSHRLSSATPRFYSLTRLPVRWTRRVRTLEDCSECIGGGGQGWRQDYS